MIVSLVTVTFGGQSEGVWTRTRDEIMVSEKRGTRFWSAQRRPPIPVRAASLTLTASLISEGLGI